MQSQLSRIKFGCTGEMFMAIFDKTAPADILRNGSTNNPLDWAILVDCQLHALYIVQNRGETGMLAD